MAFYKQLVLSVYLFCCLQTTQIAASSDHQNAPLPKAEARPVNVDPKLDCAIRELAWDYAQKALYDEVCWLCFIVFTIIYRGLLD